jgi:hypothetical protein
MNVKFTFLLAATLSWPLAIHAKLSFAATSVLVKAANDDRTLSTKYPFTNTGANAVDILSLGASCGCTVPLVDKMHYAPGESGTIAVTYTIGTAEGPQIQTIAVITTEATDNHYTLTFKAEIPRGLKTSLPAFVPVKPRLLYWRKKPFEMKPVTVDLSETPAAKVTATCDRNDAFLLLVKNSIEQNLAIIEITPTAAATGETQGELTVSLETAGRKFAPSKVSLRIFPEKTPEAVKN